jgi:hypothetical protein
LIGCLNTTANNTATRKNKEQRTNNEEQRNKEKNKETKNAIYKVRCSTRKAASAAHLPVAVVQRYAQFCAQADEDIRGQHLLEEVL